MVRVFTRENAVIAACILVALVVSSLVDTSGVGPDWLDLAVFFALAIVVPIAVNEWLDRRQR
ncbi:hypothetical protein [Salinigranum salinum]|uniref:hypothetical protein n=1 Tax=Salinigranum salinum TaxID=1364937 RepID=UPI0012609869|nr:hypothetical protein [Salinigranum salinum]